MTAEDRRCAIRGRTHRARSVITLVVVLIPAATASAQVPVTAAANDEARRAGAAAADTMLVTGYFLTGMAGGLLINPVTPAPGYLWRGWRAAAGGSALLIGASVYGRSARAGVMPDAGSADPAYAAEYNRGYAERLRARKDRALVYGSIAGLAGGFVLFLTLGSSVP